MSFEGETQPKIATPRGKEREKKAQLEQGIKGRREEKRIAQRQLHLHTKEQGGGAGARGAASKCDGECNMESHLASSGAELAQSPSLLIGCPGNLDTWSKDLGISYRSRR